jgi:hypothetical protein
MKNFRLWLEELSDSENEVLSQYGYSYLDKIAVGDMTMVLLEAPNFPSKFQYHLAFHRAGLSAFNIKHQFGRDADKKERKERGESGVGIVDGLKAMGPLMTKLVEWLKEYGKLVIASTNEELTKKWVANLTMAARFTNNNITMSSERFMGHPLHLVNLG